MAPYCSPLSVIIGLEFTTSFIMSGKWGITGYVVLSFITWGLATDPPLGMLKYLMNLMHEHECIQCINDIYGTCRNAVEIAKT